MGKTLKAMAQFGAVCVGGLGLVVGANFIEDGMSKSHAAQKQAMTQQAEQEGYFAAKFKSYADANRDGGVSFDEEVSFLRQASFSDDGARAYFSGELSKEDVVRKYESLTEGQK